MAKIWITESIISPLTYWLTVGAYKCRSTLACLCTAPISFARKNLDIESFCRYRLGCLRYERLSVNSPCCRQWRYQHRKPAIWCTSGKPWYTRITNWNPIDSTLNWQQIFWTWYGYFCSLQWSTNWLPGWVLSGTGNVGCFTYHCAIRVPVTEHCVPWFLILFLRTFACTY